MVRLTFLKYENEDYGNIKYLLDKCGISDYKRKYFIETDLKLINVILGKIYIKFYIKKI